jgi:drug/metabolite transporter (DMT)-like permease
VGAALVVIAVGIVLASIPASGVHPTLRAGNRRAAGFALAAAIAFGASLYAAGRAGATLPASWVAISARLVGAVVVAVPLAWSRRLALSRRVLPLLISSGICEVLGFYAYTVGARHGIAVAAVLASQFGALAALGGFVVFRERLDRLQLLGVAVVVLGVAVLSALRT